MIDRISVIFDITDGNNSQSIRILFNGNNFRRNEKKKSVATLTFVVCDSDIFLDAWEKMKFSLLWWTLIQSIDAPLSL